MNHIEFHKGAIDASGCITGGWNLVKQNYGLFLGISLVAMLLVACIPCVNVFIAGPVMCGVYYCFLKEMRGEPTAFGEMFKGFDNFVPAMVVGIIAAIPEIIGQGVRLTVNLADLGIKMRGGDSSSSGDFYQADEQQAILAGGLMIFVIVVGIVLFLASIALRISLCFALPLIMEHRLGVVDAIKLSARAAWGNVGGIILLFILEFCVALAGLLVFCVGIFFVIPILYAANAFAYRQVFPYGGQNFQTAPPPPDVYGGSYGVGQ